MDRLKILEERISAIEEKLDLDKYKWNWCCDDFKEFCQRTNGTVDKAQYTQAVYYRRIFIFSGRLFKMCPFCGEIL